MKRTLCRDYAVSRMEQDLWTFVYEHLWAWTVAKAVPKPRPVRVRPSQATSSSAFARGA
jgi:hypothetical protein